MNLFDNNNYVGIQKLGVAPKYVKLICRNGIYIISSQHDRFCHLENLMHPYIYLNGTEWLLNNRNVVLGRYNTDDHEKH